jgi:hypothetical protein
VIVYRYFNLTYGLEALQTGQWKVSRLDKLNDVFDCRPHIKNLPTSFALSEDEYIRNLAGMLGLICYSKKIDDPVVWSHYGQIHQGLALGIEFVELDPDFYKVLYSKKRPVLDFKKMGPFPQYRAPGETKKDLIRAAFAQKHPSWEYEDEYRHFLVLDSCRMKGEHHFKALPWDRLKEIVLGAKCPVTMQDIDRIISNHHADELVNRQLINLPRPRIHQCRLCKASYDLAFDELPR